MPIADSNATNENDEAQVIDGSFLDADTIQKSITTEEIANVSGTNMVGRKTIMIQPLNGTLKIGFATNQLKHRITKNNFFEAKISDNINIYIESQSGSAVDVAITELK